MTIEDFEDLADIVQSLTAIVEEETGRLLAPGRHADMREMAEAKARLVASLEAQNVRLTRERPDWMAELDAAAPVGGTAGPRYSERGMQMVRL